MVDVSSAIKQHTRVTKRCSEPGLPQTGTCTLSKPL